MLKLAICDDNINDRSNIYSLVLEWSQDKINYNRQITIDVFDNGDALLSNGSYDIILLDVLMPILNGIDTALELRKKDESVSIIYLTSSPEYALDSYKVRASDYLLKPVDRTALFKSLNNCVSVIDKRPEDCLLVPSGGALVKIPIHNIECIEASNHTVLFHLRDKSTLKANGKLSDYGSKLLAKGNFIKIHRSYIVNMDRIEILSLSDIKTFSHPPVPVSRALYAEIKKKYMDYMFPSDEEPGYDI